MRSIPARYIVLVLFPVLSAASATFGGAAYGGPNSNYVINTCSTFNRPVLSDCDGHAAATDFCRQKGFSRSIGFDRAPLYGHGSSYVTGSDQVVEAAFDNQYILTNVVCDNQRRLGTGD